MRAVLVLAYTDAGWLPFISLQCEHGHGVVGYRQFLAAVGSFVCPYMKTDRVVWNGHRLFE